MKKAFSLLTLAGIIALPVAGMAGGTKSLMAVSLSMATESDSVVAVDSADQVYVTLDVFF